MKNVFRKLGIHPSWDCLFKELFQDEKFKKIERVLGNCKFCPEKKDIFRVFSMSIEDINVVILGQDPYARKEVANGLAFATNNKETPYSLEVIYSEIERSFYSRDFTPERLNIIDNNLLHWHQQGIFLLNTALTVQEGKPNSHTKYWQWFTQKVIEYITEYTTGLVWLLWGKKAQEFQIDETLHYVFKAPHPAKGAYTGKDEFIGCNHFIETSKIIKYNKGIDLYWDKYYYSLTN